MRYIPCSALATFLPLTALHLPHAFARRHFLHRTYVAMSSSSYIAFIAHNCGSHDRRELLVALLEKHVRVDSFSTCLHNKPWPSDARRQGSVRGYGGDKKKVVREYMFVVAAENSVEEDYVTEKVCVRVRRREEEGWGHTRRKTDREWGRESEKR